MSKVLKPGGFPTDRGGRPLSASTQSIQVEIPSLTLACANIAANEIFRVCKIAEIGGIPVPGSVIVVTHQEKGDIPFQVIGPPQYFLTAKPENRLVVVPVKPMEKEDKQIIMEQN